MTESIDQLNNMDRRVANSPPSPRHHTPYIITFNSIPTLFKCSYSICPICTLQQSSPPLRPHRVRNYDHFHSAGILKVMVRQYLTFKKLYRLDCAVFYVPANTV